MSFFRKMKERLFKSSAQLGQGLEAIVEEDGDEAAPDPAREPRPGAGDDVGAPRGDPGGLTPPDPPPATPGTTGEPGDAGRRPVALPNPGSIPVTQPPPPTPPDTAPDTPADEPGERQGFLARTLGRMTGDAGARRRVLDDAMLEELEELLITADMGVETALKISARLADGRYGTRVSTEEIKAALADEIAKVLKPVARPLPIYSKRPQVVLVVGVNGSGKTTTIGKLAAQLREAGKSVVVAACDTFRAAAVEQLQVWGERAGVPVLTAAQGSDPAALAYDAMAKAEAEGADLLLVDTAGRLQNRADLMEELAKIVRVLAKRDPDAPHNTVLVLDATTGQNALSQVEIFQKIADVTGLVMTKLDGTAKGGVLVALADRFNLPIHAIGVGEQLDDLSPFDAADFAAALTGVERERV
ncbi:MAG TPA: signal recognition particle-docking protein FtsY [Thermohalobaculum sp.]|nr:signal recognition particle-docking protein FtsY [Thermohalobaculum sp.]